ncbi:MAG TPA: LCP family protein, partial [Rectinemataceae bacterium]|nr:LCP family protein [Rectinemataceae bacterium]
MKRFALDKSSILLIVIVGILVAGIVFLALSLRMDAVEQATKTDRIINMAIIVEQGGKPASTQLFMFYPANGRGALLDVPGETGLIIKSLKRVDRIDALYSSGHPRAFVQEIANLLGTQIPYWMIVNESGLVRVSDLLDGLQMFIPTAIDLPGPPTALLASGALVLDGDKVAQFSSYHDPDESDSDSSARRQKLLQSLFRRMGERSAWLVRPDVFPVFRSTLQTNIPDSSLRRLIPQLAKLDTDRLVLQRVTGAMKNVDGKLLLFPHYDGELVRDIVKQTLNALANTSNSNSGDKIYTLEVLNGTPGQGLAMRAAEIYQSFGYDVVTVGNADRDDYDKTQIVAHFSNPDEAAGVAAVIRCTNV